MKKLLQVQLCPDLYSTRAGESVRSRASVSTTTARKGDEMWFCDWLSWSNVEPARKAEQGTAEEAWGGVWAWLVLKQLLSAVGIQQHVQPEQVGKSSWWQGFGASLALTMTQWVEILLGKECLLSLLCLRLVLPPPVLSLITELREELGFWDVWGKDRCTWETTLCDCFLFSLPVCHSIARQ